MNRPANRPGYLAGNRAANRAGYLAGSSDRTEQLTESGTGSPHVRAIASRPVPSCPNPSRPNPGAIPHDRDQQLNGEQQRSAVQAEVARRQREPGSKALPQRGNRHSMTTVRRARELAGATWSPTEISRLLAREGVDVDARTIAGWLNPDIAASRDYQSDMSNRRRAQRAGARPMGRAVATADFKLGRCRALHELGIPAMEIALLLSFDFGDDLREASVLEALRAGSYPEHATRKAIT